MEASVVGVFASAKWILMIMLVYIGVILFLGFKYAGKIEESDDLVLAGRGLTLPFLVPSIVATWICAGAMMGAAGEAYIGGFQAVVFDPFAAVLMMFLIAIFFAYRLRKAGYTTVVDFFDDKFGKKMGMLYLIVQVLSAVGWLGGQLVALGYIVFLTTGFSMNLAIVIGAITMIVVTYFGGLMALSRVDAISVLLMIVGLFIMLAVVMGHVGGFSEFVATADNWLEVPTFAITPVSADRGGYLWYTGILGITYYISAWAALGLGDIPSQVILQRALAAKDEKTATKGFMVSGFVYLTLGLIPVLIGIAMYTWGLELPLGQAEMVLPWVADNFLPPWAAVLFVVSLTATIVSTVGNTALICSTMIGHNLYKHFRPNATTQDELRMIRIAIPIVTAVALAIALYFETVYKLIIFSGSLQLCTVFAAFAFGMFWKKANTKGAVASFFAGAISWVIFFFIVFPFTKVANFEEEIIEAGLYMDWAIWDGLYISMVPAAIVSIIVMYVVSKQTQISDPPRPLINAKGELMDDKFFFWSKDKPTEEVK
ncbi:sodium:solute symporter family transporter [Natronincola ferrireducens]|uniref:Transporter, SSS family n=1 Tax=Natronincola ferrireducens TaxID=393762 RepID=A0A1G8YKR6_9FIRM|nr:hypothetical protein [Natronincola ferrireducens]SDK03388.1 transporter, SSS family [Natronincola ferrireducens]